MVVIASWEELRARSGDIVAALGKDENLMLAAGTNPLLALAELGYEVAEEARPAIMDRLRLPPAAVKRRAELREEIAALAGRPVDPDSAGDLRRLLFDEMKLRPYPDARGCYPSRPSVEPPRKRLAAETADPLETLRGKHPVMGPLLEYRALGAEAWPFAGPRAYEAIRAGKIDMPVRNPRIRFKRGRARRQNHSRPDDDHG